MKYTINGYQQTVLIEYNLDAMDAAILRYIDDFYNSGKMYHKIINNQVYFWVNFGTIIDDMPILGISETRGISRRFEKFVKCGLMEKHLAKGKDMYLYDGRECERAGTFTYFTFNPEKKLALVGDNKESDEKDPYKRRYASKGRPSEGSPSKGLPDGPQKADPVDLKRPTKDTSFINNSIKDIYMSQKNNNKKYYKIIAELDILGAVYKFRDDRIIWDARSKTEYDLIDIKVKFPEDHPVRLKAAELYKQE